MLTLKGPAHIATSRNIKSFRWCAHSTAEPMAHLDIQKLAREEKRLAAREARGFRLAKQWIQHLEHVAGPLRVLPPSARYRQTSQK